jgi:hypothetical protein
MEFHHVGQVMAGFLDVYQEVTSPWGSAKGDFFSAGTLGEQNSSWYYSLTEWSLQCDSAENRRIHLEIRYSCDACEEKDRKPRIGFPAKHDTVRDMSRCTARHKLSIISFREDDFPCPFG